MKKIAAAAVSIGVILVIVGLVMVGIFGGEAIRNISWGDIFSGTNHDLSKANESRDFAAADLTGVANIAVNVDRYAVYVLPSDDDVLRVKYVTPLEDGVSVNAVLNESSSTVEITETDNFGSTFFGGVFSSNRFIVVYVPQSEAMCGCKLSVNADTAGVKIQNVRFRSVSCETKTGALNVSDCVIDQLSAETNTGAININELACVSLTAQTNTGAINVNETTADNLIDIEVNTGAVNCNATSDTLTVHADTGSVNFNAKANVLNIETDTGSVNGTVIGDESEYQIKVKKGTGRSNIENQHVVDAVKFLTVEVDTGSINIKFKND